MFICNQFTKSISFKKLINLTLFMICTVFFIIEIPTNLHIQRSTQNNFPNNEIDKSYSLSFELDGCHCTRTLSHRNTKDIFDKVSYWTDWTAIGLIPPFNGSEQRYFEGIRDNLRLMPYHYPGWIMQQCIFRFSKAERIKLYLFVRRKFSISNIRIETCLFMFYCADI